MDELHDTEHLESTVDLDDPPASVWDAITDPTGVEAWLGDGSTLVPVEGTALDVADAETGIRRQGVVEHVDPGRGLVFTWWPADAHDERSRVAIHLAPNGSGTRLVVTEQRMTASASLRPTTAPGAWPWRMASVELSLMAPRLPVGASGC